MFSLEQIFTALAWATSGGLTKGLFDYWWRRRVLFTKAEQNLREELRAEAATLRGELRRRDVAEVALRNEVFTLQKEREDALRLMRKAQRDLYELKHSFWVEYAQQNDMRALVYNDDTIPVVVTKEGEP